MGGVLAFGATDRGQLLGHSLEVAGAALAIARALDCDVSGALIGSGCLGAAQYFASVGLARVLVVDDAELDRYVSDRHVGAALAIVGAQNPDVIILPHTSETMEWAPILAARLGAAMAMNCSRLTVENGVLIAVRPVFGGALEAEYEFNRPIKMASLAARAVAPAAAGAVGAIEAVAMAPHDARMRVIVETPDPSDGGRELKGASIVVAGGLGMNGRENWRLIEEAAAALDAAVGATRAVVEMGWAGATRQVGFSGQKVAPELYIAAGISGAVHHLAGISAAKTVIAINKDAQAPIFRRARFGVVGDAKEVLPAFTARVRELREQKIRS
jgi:electron transfer flavoprotein alpha subunit